MKKIIYFIMVLAISLVSSNASTRIENKISTMISNKISIFSTFVNHFNSDSVTHKEIDIGFNLKQYTDTITNLELFNRQNWSKLNNHVWKNRYDWITGATIKYKFIHNRLRIKYIDSDYCQFENRIKFKYNHLYISSELVYYRSLNKIKYEIGYSSKCMTNIIYGISYNWNNRKINSSWEFGESYIEVMFGLVL